MQQLLHTYKIYCLHFLSQLWPFYFLSSLGINIWSTTFIIYLMTFVMHKFDLIKNKITSSHWCFYIILISQRKWLKEFINNFINLIIRCKLLLVEYITCSFVSFEEIKLIAIVNWIFHVSELWRSIIISLK